LKTIGLLVVNSASNFVAHKPARMLGARHQPEEIHDIVLRGNLGKKPYCLTGECSPDFKRCLTALVPVAS